MKLEAFRPGLLPAVVRFWNRSFSDRRNFFRVSEKLFSRRVVEKRSVEEPFDPRGFILALEGRRIVGLVHAGVRSEARCRALDPHWPGGDQGVIYVIHVDPKRRRRGIGGALWHRALEFAGGSRQVVFGGQGADPFYGKSAGPITPFWGTPEGIAVEGRDAPTQKFLARKGFAPRYKAVQLSLDLTEAGVPAPAETARALERQGFRLRRFVDRLPQVGKVEGVSRVVPSGIDFECLSASRAGRTVGSVVTFPLKEVRRGLYAVYEATVVEELRGRALGKRLLAAALGRMKDRQGAACEVLTVPEVSPAASKVYEGAGFKPVARWAIY